MTNLSPAWAVLVVIVGVLATGVLVWRRRAAHPQPAQIRPQTAQTLPALQLRVHEDDVHVLPQVIQFPASGRLRIGYHPPLMNRHVGRAEFERLPFVDIRGDAAAVRELSRHAACIWRDADGECFVQLGWPGPGEPIRPRNQARVLRFGRPHDAASQPFRLAHRDVLRLSSHVEYVFLEVEAVRDRPTPEQKKIEAFESGAAPSSTAKLSLVRPERRTALTPSEPDDDDDMA
ncbi:MAG TPA: hypothetical protein VFG86_05125 [Chloroflexota bacterium]|nr:hypothetical protein [Chloroflexota bacterium]